MKYKFKNVYRQIKNEEGILKYNKINSNVEMCEMFVESLLRSSTAFIKEEKGHLSLYYNM